MVVPPTKPDEPCVSELRAESRTHLFVAAMLSAGAALTPVHIRNLSASGALVEGSALPAVGSAVSIRRAALSVEGVMAWRSENRAGIAFRSQIFVPAWLPRKNGSSQCTVDRIVHDAKNRPKAWTDRPPADCIATGPEWVLAELKSLKTELIRLGDALVEDVILVATHPEIQVLDVAVQKIDRLMALTVEQRLTPEQTRT